MIYLLDVNVLIALIDRRHVHHGAANDWFDRTGLAGWATCPLTQNGLIRIISGARYPNTPNTPAEVADLVNLLLAVPGHVFWPDDISLLDPRFVDPRQLVSPAQITDTYLLALAVAHGGHLATFDRKLSAIAVRGGAEALVVI